MNLPQISKQGNSSLAIRSTIQEPAQALAHFSKLSTACKPRHDMSPQKYFIVIRGNSFSEMTEEVLHFVYFFLSRALTEHRQEGRNGEYEAFAVEVLALLQKYRHLYTTLPKPPEPVLGDTDA
jgi:hypothetical protein